MGPKDPRFKSQSRAPLPMSNAIGAYRRGGTGVISSKAWTRRMFARLFLLHTFESTLNGTEWGLPKPMYGLPTHVHF